MAHIHEQPHRNAISFGRHTVPARTCLPRRYDEHDEPAESLSDDGRSPRRVRSVGRLRRSSGIDPRRKARWSPCRREPSQHHVDRTRGGERVEYEGSARQECGRCPGHAQSARPVPAVVHAQEFSTTSRASISEARCAGCARPAALEHILQHARARARRRTATTVADLGAPVAGRALRRGRPRESSRITTISPASSVRRARTCPGRSRRSCRTLPSLRGRGLRRPGTSTPTRARRGPLPARRRGGAPRRHVHRRHRPPGGESGCPRVHRSWSEVRSGNRRTWVIACVERRSHTLGELAHVLPRRALVEAERVEVGGRPGCPVTDAHRLANFSRDALDTLVERLRGRAAARRPRSAMSSTV